jgi:hypothetical protein
MIDKLSRTITFAMSERMWKSVRGSDNMSLYIRLAITEKLARDRAKRWPPIARRGKENCDDSRGCDV